MRRIDEDAIIERYVRREKVRQIAKKFGVSPQTVYNILERRDLPQLRTSISDLVPKLIEMCAVGVPIVAAAQRLGMSESTATRALRKYRKDGGRLSAKRGRPSAARAASAAYMIEGDTLHGTPFPFPKMLPDDEIQQELARLRELVCHVEHGEIRPRSLLGLRVCYPFFPNRYHARFERCLSAFDAWHTASELEKAIHFQRERGDPTTPERVLRALTLRCRTPTIFRPAVAQFIYRRYCPRGGRVYDPCVGYGGRLLGAVAAGVHYIGTDVEPATIDGNRRMSAALGVNAELHLTGAEVFEPPAVDLVFTSPPYFDRERYSDTPTQSWRRYATLDEWVDGFLRPMTERAFRALPRSGYFVLNIADLKKNGKTVPLVARTVQTSCDVGFEHVETLRMPLAAINRTRPYEPVLVFRKL